MTARSARRGFFQSAIDAVVQARMAQAERYANDALLRLDDETLKAHGYSREALKRNSGGAFFL
ncbi:MAG: hypothetical protein ACTHLC_19285 [Rhizobiaceae bacterium]